MAGTGSGRALLRGTTKAESEAHVFVNSHEEDIFIVNLDNKEIHLASKLSESCNLDRKGDGEHKILPVESASEFENVLKRLKLNCRECRHCFKK